MTKVEISIDQLKEFCADKNFGRKNLENIFIKDGYAYATNGHILIRVDCNEQNSNGEYPNVQTLIESIEDNCDLIIDFAQEIKYKTKPKYAIKQNSVDCDNCDGQGVVRCSECGGDKECKKCGGEGKLQETLYSDEIVGEEYIHNYFIKINDSYFDQGYIHLIAKHFPKIGIIKSIAATRSMKLQFDDALIILMPIKYMLGDYYELKLGKQ